MNRVNPSIPSGDEINPLDLVDIRSNNPSTPQSMLNNNLNRVSSQANTQNAAGGQTNEELTARSLEANSPLGMALQMAALGGQGAMLLGGVDRQPLRLANSPINVQQFDPTQSLAAQDNAYSALRQQARNTTSRSSMMSNLQNMASNQARGQASIVDRYNQMNKQAQTQFEQRKAQREAQNLQRRYAVDQMRAQDEAAYRGGVNAFLGSISNLGQSKVSQAENRRSTDMILSAYPDIAQFFLQQQANIS